MGLPSIAEAAGTGFAPAAGTANIKAAPVPNNVVHDIIALFDFAAFNGDLAYDGGTKGVYNTGSSYVLASVPMQQPTYFYGLTGFSTPGVSAQTWTIGTQNLLTGAIVAIAFAGTTGTAYQGVNVIPSSPVFLDRYVRLWAECAPANAVGQTASGAGYFYYPLHPGFVPISPVRIFDSRIDAPGRIGSGTTVTLSAATDENGAASGIPQFAAAIHFTITVTDTAGAGYLAVFPQGVAWPGNSSINWFAPGLTLANAGTVAFGGDRQISVRCGGGATDYIIDVTGYYI